MNPVLAVRDCAGVRLISGEAKALWTGRDGKPAVAEVRPDAAPQGYPGAAGTYPTQRIIQAIQALTTDGRGSRSGYKRFDEGGESADLYVPAAGLSVSMPGSQSWTLVGLRGRSEVLIARGTLGPDGAVALQRQQFDGFDAVRLEFQSPDRRQRWLLRRLPLPEQLAVERALAEIAELGISDSSTHALASALVYENFGLSLNRDISLLQR